MEYEKIEQTKARLAEVDIQLTKAEAQYAMIVEMMGPVLKLQEKRSARQGIRFTKRKRRTTSYT